MQTQHFVVTITTDLFEIGLAGIFAWTLATVPATREYRPCPIALGGVIIFALSLAVVSFYVTGAHPGA